MARERSPRSLVRHRLASGSDPTPPLRPPPQPPPLNHQRRWPRPLPPPSPALHSRRSLPRCNSFASQVFGVFASVPPPDLCRRQIFATAFFLSPPVAFPAWSWLHLLKASYMLFRLLDQRISHRPEQCSRGTPRGSVAQARRWHPSLAGTGATPPSRPPPSSTSAAALPDRLRASWEGPFLTCCSPFLARNFVSWHLRWWGLLHPLSEAHELNGETRFLHSAKEYMLRFA